MERGAGGGGEYQIVHVVRATSILQFMNFEMMFVYCGQVAACNA